MSLGYAISTVIDLQYNPINIQKILEKGAYLEFLYYTFTFEDVDLSKKIPLSLEVAASLIFNGIPDQMHCVFAQKQEMYFNLYILKESDNTTIVFHGFKNAWYRAQSNPEDYDLDLVRYTRLMLDLIEEYRLIELEVKKD